MSRFRERTPRNGYPDYTGSAAHSAPGVSRDAVSTVIGLGLLAMPLVVPPEDIDPFHARIVLGQVGRTVGAFLLNRIADLELHRQCCDVYFGRNQ